MSFLMDIPLLVVWGIILGYLNKRFLKKGKKDALWFLEVLTIIVFWGVSIPLYLGYINLTFLGDAGRGPWFMWNSGLELFGLHPNVQPSHGLLPIAALLFLSYPLWLLWGVERGKHLFGRAPSQGGFLWLFNSKP